MNGRGERWVDGRGREKWVDWRGRGRGGGEGKRNRGREDWKGGIYSNRLIEHM